MRSECLQMASFALVANVYFACIGLFALLNLLYVAAGVSALALAASTINS